jgi:endonuclease YncB( thermonuclease family)
MRLGLRGAVLAILLVGNVTTQAGDLLPTGQEALHPTSAIQPIIKLTGVASVIDGRTLWLPGYGLRVRLAGIDACELPQWAFDPDRVVATGDKLKPVPCGAFAKAWLKRTIQNRQVECRVLAGPDGLAGPCRAGGRDLALELLRAGWARAVESAGLSIGYHLAESQAKAARYGMWATYVLDMDEWRMKAVDKTVSRRPVADYNLLRERRLEISPPFANARRLPWRTDR